ncbi:metallophosphoesterase [Streptomyces graminifolii]|uniref:metallophosphoesterase n=1 Tax=Streptomyces graminifolii TaxID=1266771 RepID=UPI0040584BE7
MPIRVLQLSDTHLTAAHSGNADTDPDHRLRSALEAHRRTGVHADLTVVSGDLADDGSAPACRRLAAALAPLRTPVLAVPGNHDDPDTVAETFPSDMLETQGWRILGIDTSRPGDIHGTIDTAAETNRLDALDERPTVLVLHHPPLSPSAIPAFQLVGGGELMAALRERPYVKALLTGHLHDPFELRTDTGIQILGCPSTLIGFRHTGDDTVIGEGHIVGVRQVTLHDDGTVSSTVVAS